MLFAFVLSAQLLSAVQADDSSARVEHLDQAAPVAQPAPAPATNTEGGANLSAGPTTRRKSTHALVALGEFGLGAVGAYLALALGVVVNFPHGGLSPSADLNDVLLLMVLPGVIAAATSWLIGLFDYSQRSILGSAIWAVLGGGLGEVIGLGAGVLIGHAVSEDNSLQSMVMIFVAPGFAALGSMLFMEIFKPGEEIPAYASISVARSPVGGVVLGPAVGWRW